MLALAWLLSSAPGWEKSRLRLNTIVTDVNDREVAERRLDDMIEERRLSADREVHVREPGGDVWTTITAASTGAGLVFLGVRPPTDDESPEDYAVHYGSLMDHTAGLPPTAMVLAAEDLNFRKLFE